MGTGLRERLAGQTAEACEVIAPNPEDLARERRSKAAKRGAATRKFLGRHYQPAITELEEDLNRASACGESEQTKTWDIQDSGYFVPDEEKIRLHRVLRDRVAQYFVEAGLDVRVFERRPEIVNENIPISDGYSYECPPMKDAGYTEVGLWLSWGEPGKST